MSIHAMSSKQASLVKINGHKREVVFNQKYGNPDDEINWSGASADCEIHDESLINILRRTIGFPGNGVSLKGGNTIQIHLGNLPELTSKNKLIVEKNHKGHTKVGHGINFSEQVSVLKTKSFWNKYLRKGDVLAYSYDNGQHIFFNMDDVIDFIITECEWRLLDTGRLKGDFFGHQHLTYEYRKKKGLFVLGAHGGRKGKEFIELLKNKIRSHTQ
tara:strand:- start:1051 stop:1695 length:645 start_codon:yes stop_codon:yes gene_type:complete